MSIEKGSGNDNTKGAVVIGFESARKRVQERIALDAAQGIAKTLSRLVADGEALVKTIDEMEKAIVTSANDAYAQIPAHDAVRAGDLTREALSAAFTALAFINISLGKFSDAADLIAPAPKPKSP